MIVWNLTYNGFCWGHSTWESSGLEALCSQPCKGVGILKYGEGGGGGERITRRIEQDERDLEAMKSVVCFGERERACVHVCVRVCSGRERMDIHNQISTTCERVTHWSQARSLLHVWQSWVESNIILLRISVTLPCSKHYHRTSVKGGTHACFVDSWIPDISTQRVWAPPLTEVLHCSASNTVMQSKYATE